MTLPDSALQAAAEKVSWCVNHRNLAWEDFEERPFDEFLSRGYRCPSGSWIEGANAWDCSVEEILLIPVSALGGRVVVEKPGCVHGRSHPHPLPIDEFGGVPVSPDEWTGECPGGEHIVIWEGE